MTDQSTYIAAFAKILHGINGGNLYMISQDPKLELIEKKPAPKRTRFEKIAIGYSICAYVSLGQYTLESICRKFETTELIFLSWVNREGDTSESIPELTHAYDAACVDAMEYRMAQNTSEPPAEPENRMR